MLFLFTFLTGWSVVLSACSCLSPSWCRPLCVFVAPPADFFLHEFPGPSAAPPAHELWDEEHSTQKIRNTGSVQPLIIKYLDICLEKPGTVTSHLWTSCVFSCFSLDLRSPFIRISFSSSATFFSRELTWQKQRRLTKTQSYNLNVIKLHLQKNKKHPKSKQLKRKQSFWRWKKTIKSKYTDFFGSKRLNDLTH